MSDTPLLMISERITAAHARIQKNFKKIDPVVGVNQGMRTVGIPADLMTIDCLKTGKRIILLFHDQQLDAVSYQFWASFIFGQK